MFGVLMSVAMAVAMGPAHWVAVSNTAMSITGDVTFTATRMTFQNGQAIDLQYLTIRPTSATERTNFGDAAHYRLYKITSSTNPTLQNGNKLCGARPSYLTVAYQSEVATGETTVLVAFYTGSNPPPQWQESSTLCATFTFTSK